MLQPFDTIKTLQQANTGKLPQGMLQTATTLVNERGAVSLYRGLGVALLGSVPAMCAPRPPSTNRRAGPTAARLHRRT